ncbi:ATP-dependent DNA helicase [Alteromonas sp. 5E99-2]|uniref:ATP-dependent DNA helicase n=1 Tax=Alteromonas sp. 5E99-2 TaxID=2817683 RepID=UPI001A98526E|nr:ATP-dependent DNA helicase [Alteromonas sp. 5E99-2]MBO1255156.1 ATP-dependent DNA helicase [Alteromonas sp. 5E99-2]
MSQSKHTVKDAFSSQGALSQKIDGYKPRQAQTDMAVEVERVIKAKEQLIVEAGTGTGKTFAYLIPALLAPGKCIVSTGTKNLQEQLYHRDLPLVKSALASNKRAALLKGRANYACLHRLGQHKGGATFLDKQTLHEMSLVREWVNETKTGDIGELTELPEDAKVIPFVTSTTDNCLGRDCPDYEDCYLVKARRTAMDSDVVVVNHHLFFADLALKDTGFGELIPEANSIVFDEAHQIPDIASEYFGEAISSRQCVELAKDITVLYRTTLKDIEQLDKAAQKCQTAANDLRLCFPVNPKRGNWHDALQEEEISLQIEKLKSALSIVYEVAKIHLGRDKELDAIFERVVLLRMNLDSVCNIEKLGVSLWYETTQRHIVLHLTPLSISAKFRQIMDDSDRAWIFTSATLMVGGKFDHFQRRMGLDAAHTLGLESPFNYEEQALLCVPRHIPEPSNPKSFESLLSISLSLIKSSKGRCFLLFTSHYVLRKMAEALADKVDNTLLVQGSTTKRALLQQFVDEPDAVLLGTGAFWEGVDVRGDALVCVLIDKLPFAAPDDPLLQARIEDCKKRGANPFANIQIPQAVISLKQGAGRLIRDSGDKGVLVICDTRLVTHNYGKTFLSSLPTMRRTRDLNQVTSFLEKL